MPIRTVEIPEELDRFISTSVESGRFKDIDSVVRTALEVLDQEEQNYDYKIYQLRKAIQEGLDSGDAEGSTDEVFARVRERVGLPVRTRA